MRYQNFNDRLRRLRSAAEKGGWTLTNMNKVHELPFWVATNSAVAERPPRIAWAMMHGNEPTGFEALVKFIERGTPVSNWILVPLVNPTGIDAFSRLTGSGFDLNRRAREFGPIESDCLKSILQSAPFELALNLHDQRSIFHPEMKQVPSTLSVLAPNAMNGDLLIQPARAMAWAGSIFQWINRRQPSWGYARFDETYYPTAFGEWSQELGVPTVTIETGIALGDASRAKVGHELFNAICMADESLEPLPNGQAAYLSLPYNRSTGCDFAIQGSNERSYWKLWEQVQNGSYTAGIERVEKEQQEIVPYQEIAVADSEYSELVQQSVWTHDGIYASGMVSLRDLAEALPK